MTTNIARARRHPYWRLLQKEAIQALPTVLVFTVVLVAWYAFLYTRTGRWSGIITILPLAMLPWGFIGPWTLWRCVATLRQEWPGNHMHLLLALPVPGWYVTSVKPDFRH